MSFVPGLLNIPYTPYFAVSLDAADDHLTSHCQGVTQVPTVFCQTHVVPAYCAIQHK